MSTQTSFFSRLAALPLGSLLAILVPLLSAGFQLYLLLSDQEAPVWLGPLESLGVTVLALLAGLWLLARSVRDTRAQADHFHVGEALAVGYGLNFLQPTGQRLQHGVPAGQLLQFIDSGDGPAPPAATRVERLLVALPRVVDGLDNATIMALRRALRERLGEGWWVGSARLSPAHAAAWPAGTDTQASKSNAQSQGPADPGTGRGVGVTAVVHRASGATVLIDLPSTLAVVPHFAEFVAGRELDGSPWANELVSAARSNIVRRFEADKFASVLQQGLEEPQADQTADAGDARATDKNKDKPKRPSAEQLLRRRLVPLRAHIELVTMESAEDVAPLLAQVRSAARKLVPDAR